jgi:hypothetical protein
VIFFLLNETSDSLYLILLVKTKKNYLISLTHTSRTLIANRSHLISHYHHWSTHLSLHSFSLRFTLHRLSSLNSSSSSFLTRRLSTHWFLHHYDELTVLSDEINHSQTKSTFLLDEINPFSPLFTINWTLKPSLHHSLKFVKP